MTIDLLLNVSPYRQQSNRKGPTTGHGNPLRMKSFWAVVHHAGPSRIGGHHTPVRTLRGDDVARVRRSYHPVLQQGPPYTCPLGGAKRADNAEQQAAVNYPDHGYHKP
ncbi:jg17891 [Pararge aegeria aegeria]|uniref:Jg17891 protein n=1 Tax=Pararge aegeria aegeria TaxID=348720 RepID=A0A8S4SJ64_9NEOP|nr:jg17891 [Pararge aegeria aegeria]